MAPCWLRLQKPAFTKVDSLELYWRDLISIDHSQTIGKIRVKAAIADCDKAIRIPMVSQRPGGIELSQDAGLSDSPVFESTWDLYCLLTCVWNMR